MLFGILYDRPNGHRYAFVALALNTLGAALVPHVTGGVAGGPGSDEAAGAETAGGRWGGANGSLGEVVGSLGGVVGGGAPRVSQLQLLAFALIYGLGYGGVLTIVSSKVCLMRRSKAE